MLLQSSDSFRIEPFVVHLQEDQYSFTNVIQGKLSAKQQSFSSVQGIGNTVIQGVAELLNGLKATLVCMAAAKE